MQMLLLLHFQPPPPDGLNSTSGADLQGINTLSNSSRSSQGRFIQQITRLSEEEAVAQGYTVIKTAQDLDNIRNDLDGKYILMNDIDLSSYANWDPIGDVDTGIAFSGTLDGNGYVVKNLTINRPTEDGVGLFAIIGDVNTMSGGEVKNLGLENVDIRIESNTSDISVGALAAASTGIISNCYISGGIKGEDFTGGIVGMNAGTISDCSSSAVVTGDKNYTGGIVGYNIQGTITNSYSKGTISGVHSGGIVGCSNGGKIFNCYTSSSVTGGVAGGLVGYLGDGTVSNSYATGLVQGTTSAGGLIGLTGNAPTLENSIWNTQTTGQSVGIGDNQGGTDTNNKGLTTSQMQDSSNWSGWDTSIWDFSTYPPTFKTYSPIDSPSNPGGGTGGGTDPSNPGGGNAGGGGNTPPVTPEGSIRLQIGADSTGTSVIYVDTSFDLGAFDVDFSSADSCAEAIDDIDSVLEQINTKRAEFGAAINRLNSILESQTTTIQNYTAAKSTIMDADIAVESADFVKSQILQQTSSALLAQSQNIHSSIVLSLIQ